MCQEFCRGGGVLAALHVGLPPGQTHLLGRHPLGRHTPIGRHPTPWVDTPHSCCILFPAALLLISSDLQIVQPATNRGIVDRIIANPVLSEDTAQLTHLRLTATIAIIHLQTESPELRIDLAVQVGI